MTDDSQDFNNTKIVDLEGVMAYFNDSVIPPFDFPADFASNSDYLNSEDDIKFFFNWLIEQHNAQVEDFQKFKVGRIAFSDLNGDFERSLEDYTNTWDVLKTRLFESSLGGYLCIRYEYDENGNQVNIIDYLPDFKDDDGAYLMNLQEIVFGENMLDLVYDSDATETYTAVIPLGKKNETTKKRLTIADLPDAVLQSTGESGKIIKKGVMIYNEKAVNQFGFICAPPSETTWDDIDSDTGRLQTNGVDFLVNTAVKFLNTITVKALDLHFSDAQIEAFRIYRYVKTKSAPHGMDHIQKLDQLEIDMQNPQNTIITMGDSSLSLIDINSSNKQALSERVETALTQTKQQAVDISEIQNVMSEQSAAIVGTCESIILAALESYVETSNYEEFKETLQAQLQIMSDEISVRFTAITNEIEMVNGDLQEKFNQIIKYFTFDINGLIIGQIDNPNKVVIDNDNISILVNDIEVLWFDANGKAHVPELKVSRSFNLFGYLIDQDEYGNVNCEYVGGEG